MKQAKRELFANEILCRPNLKTPTKQNPTHEQYCAQISEPTLKKLSRPQSTASWDRGDHPTGERRSPHLLTISTLCKQGHFSEALGVLGITGKHLDCSMYVCLLQGCIQRNALPEGKVIHAHIKQSRFTGDVGFYEDCIRMKPMAIMEFPQENTTSFCLTKIPKSSNGAFIEVQFH